MIDERSEWRTFSDSDKPGGDPNRVGGPVNALLRDGGLSTMIGVSKGVDRGLTHNLQRMQSRTEESGDRALMTAFREVARVCSSMKLPDAVKHQANEYYRDAQEKSRAIRGRSQASVVAAVIFLACRQTGYPRAFKEIRAFVPQAQVKDIGKSYKIIVADLKLKETGGFRSEVEAIHPENFLRRFMSSLGFVNADMVAAVALANAMIPQTGPSAVEHAVWHGKSPITVAGTIMFVFSHLPRASKHPPLDDISAVAGVAEATIKSTYKEMLPHMPRLVATAGGFATAEEIAQLPTLEKPSLQQAQQPASQQQQQQQQPAA